MGQKQGYSLEIGITHICFALSGCIKSEIVVCSSFFINFEIEIIQFVYNLIEILIMQFTLNWVM